MAILFWTDGWVEKNSWNLLINQVAFGNGLSMQRAEIVSFLILSIVES